MIVKPEKNAKSQYRVEKILDAAIEVFSQKGYRDTGMEDIVVESQTSKGGIYFHFPNKQTIFLTLLDRMSALLLSRAEAAMNNEPDLLKRGDVMLLTMLKTFSSHRHLTRLFLVEALGAGREFNAKIMEIHGKFITLIRRYMDDMVVAGKITPLDTQIAGIAWFGAVNEVVTHWVLTDQPTDLEETYPALRVLLRRGIGLD